MRKKILLLAGLVVTPLLVACTSNEQENNLSTSINYDYDMVSDYHISFQDILSQEDDEYFAYIYSKSCRHCMNIKNEVIEFALGGHYPLYFVTYSNEIKVTRDIDSTIGAKDVNDIAILGTPTLLQIENASLIMNVAGEEDVLDVLNSYKK